MECRLQSSKAVGSGKLPFPPWNKRSQRPWVWAALGTLLVLYVFSAWRVDPIASFGTSADDALYFSSAKALAKGQGYVLPGFPVHLKATKYPELYSLILAVVWRIDPHFPENVNLAVSLTLVFGCAALIFAFLLLRDWPGLDSWSALAIVSLCGLNGYFLFLSASVRTEIPFTAAMLAAVWFSGRPEAGRRSALVAGVLAGLSVGLRSLGVTVVAGIASAFLLQREYRRCLWFCAAAEPECA